MIRIPNSTYVYSCSRQVTHPGFVQEHSFTPENGFVFLQHNLQRQLCGSFAGPIQTDAIESLISSPENCVLCVSSGFCETINRTVPLAATILFGKYRKTLQKPLQTIVLTIGHDIIFRYRR